jgi:hypothetical protein
VCLAIKIILVYKMFHTFGPGDLYPFNPQTNGYIYKICKGSFGFQVIFNILFIFVEDVTGIGRHFPGFTKECEEIKINQYTA